MQKIIDKKLKPSLAHGWIETTLENCCAIFDSKRIPINNTERNQRSLGKKKEELYPYYGATGQVGVIDDYIFEGEYVLLGEDGAPFLDFTKNKAYIVIGKFWVNNHAHILKANGSNKFLCHYFNQINFKPFVTGTTRLKLNQSSMKTIPIKLAPLPEQYRIVEKIEEHFSDLDNAISSLKIAKEQLKTYRQAVLKWAFEGKLTEEWRKQNNPEPAEKLLEKIKEQREKHYQEQLEHWKQKVKKWEETGKKGKKPSKVTSIRESKMFTDEENAFTYPIPDSWLWVRINDITLGVGYGTSAKSQKNGKVPVLRMGNIQNTKFDWSDLVFSNNDSEIKKYRLHKDDVLFNRTNSPELVGKTAIYLALRPAIFAGYLIRVNQIGTITNAKYLNYYLNSLPAKLYGKSVKTDGVNQSNINGQKLMNYPYPICTIDEQNKAVEELEARLSVCNNIETIIEETLSKAEALRQSILKKAFEGKLVPQDPDDEPASKLMERIKAEKENINSKSKTAQAKQQELNI